LARPNSNNPGKTLEEVLFDGLDDHGFLFQEKCAQLIRDNDSHIGWCIHSEEYPVTTSVKDSRVDIILRDTTAHTQDHDIYAIVECKRVNPDQGYWLFGNPLLTNYTDPLLVNLEGRYLKEDYSLRYNQIRPSFKRIGAYLIDNWWIAINRDRREKHKVVYNSSPNHIEDAFLQVCVGVSGIAHELRDQFSVDHQDKSVLLIPVVITSAPLFVATYDLDAVDIATAKYYRDRVTFGSKGQPPEELNWVLVDYGASRSIGPQGWESYFQGFSPADLEQFHKRSIFVVNSKHIVDFFGRLHLS
jgi:hypothetical protein